MSQENVEIVREIFATWAQGDFSSADWADDQIEFSIRPMDRAETTGFDAMANRFRDWMASWSDASAVAEKFMASGDMVLAFHRFKGKGRGSGIQMPDPAGACLFTLRGGKVVRLTVYTDRQLALEAAGLSE